MERIQPKTIWENLPPEERKRRVAVRMQNLGKYRNTLFINDRTLLGEA